MTYKILDAARTDKWLSEDFRLGTSEGWVQLIIPFNSKEQSKVWVVWSVCNGNAWVDDFVCAKAGTPLADELLAKYEEQKANQQLNDGGALLVDEMEDFSKIYDYSKPGGWRVFTDGVERFDNDLMRIARVENTDKYLTYKVENMHNFKADIPYCVNFGASDIIMFTTGDGSEKTIVKDINFDDLDASDAVANINAAYGNCLVSTSGIPSNNNFYIEDTSSINGKALKLVPDSTEKNLELDVILSSAVSGTKVVCEFDLYETSAAHRGSVKIGTQPVVEHTNDKYKYYEYFEKTKILRCFNFKVAAAYIYGDYGNFPNCNCNFQCIQNTG